MALGTWQLERRVWKHELVARIASRVHAEPVAPPAPGAWPQVNAADDEYRHVVLTGRFLHARATLVQASTVLGGGFWVLAPLRMASGETVMVNRGFVPTDTGTRALAPGAEPDAEVTVTGLLRITEPAGGFLRHNDAAGNRWFSRDVAAIAAARGLPAVAPYFVDADAAEHASAAAPVGGLTVVSFADHHLVYAFTWYTLALMVAGAGWAVRRGGQQRSKQPAPAAQRIGP